MVGKFGHLVSVFGHLRLMGLYFSWFQITVFAHLLYISDIISISSSASSCICCSWLKLAISIPMKCNIFYEILSSVSSSPDRNFDQSITCVFTNRVSRSKFIQRRNYQSAVELLRRPPLQNYRPKWLCRRSGRKG